jgi:outer membrane biogenesis lipoprotein LolB
MYTLMRIKRKYHTSTPTKALVQDNLVDYALAKSHISNWIQGRQAVGVPIEIHVKEQADNSLLITVNNAKGAIAHQLYIHQAILAEELELKLKKMITIKIKRAGTHQAL